MKKQVINFFFAFAMLFVSTLCFGQAPQSFSYQAVARDVNGNILANKNISLRFSIHDLTAAGIVVYQETQTPVTSNSLGLVNVNIGQGTPVSGTFSTIDWANGAKYLQVEIDPNGGSTYTSLGSSQMLSVPYALYAANGGGSGGPTGQDVIQADGTGAVTLFNGMAMTKLPGLTATVTVPANSKLMIQTTGGLYSANGGGGTVATDVEIFIDNVPIAASLERVVVSEFSGFSDGISYWSISYAATALSAGSHTIDVRTQFGKSTFSNTDTGSASDSNNNSGLQGHLFVTIIKL